MNLKYTTFRDFLPIHILYSCQAYTISQNCNFAYIYKIYRKSTSYIGDPFLRLGVIQTSLYVGS